MNNKNNLINITTAAEILGVSKDTLRNWDKSGKLKSIRTPGNHRRYIEKDIIKLSGDKENKNYLFKNKVVVYTYVCGDILHRGHLLYLKNAALLGDFLIVGVLTDEAVMEKKKKPVMCFEERIELVGCLKMVDMAVPQSTYSPSLNIKSLKPDILMESDSHDDDLIEEGRKCMEEINGRIVIAAYYPYQSSTDIKDKIKKEK